jgi:hypothetical protein
MSAPEDLRGGEREVEEIARKREIGKRENEETRARAQRAV